MSKSEIKKIAKKYADELQKANFPFSSIYIFGSYVNGLANKWSDIDIAVVSNKLKGDKDKDRLVLWRVGRKVDTRIEPYGFTVKSFKEKANPMACEIRKNGIRVV